MRKDCDTCLHDEFGEKYCDDCHSASGKQPTKWEPAPFWTPDTNADRIRAMSNEKLAEWFSSFAYGRNTPWFDEFERKFCNNCPSEMYKIKETGQVLRLHECDFADGKCPHGSDIVWWLKQPAEVNDHGTAQV